MSKYPQVAKLAIDCAVYIPEELDGQPNHEAIRVRATDVDEEMMYGEGEESGAEYAIEFSEVDLKNDMFYKFTLMDNNG